MKVPNFPILIDNLNKNYLKNVVFEYMNPILEIYDFQFKGEDEDDEDDDAIKTSEYNRLFSLNFSVFSKIKKKCYMEVYIQQNGTKDNYEVYAQIFVYNCLQEKKVSQSMYRFLDDLQLAVQRILNQIAYDANLYKSVLRNRTDKFLGPAEDLVQQYLGLDLDLLPERRSRYD